MTRLSIACLIYKSVGWLKFTYEQVQKYTDLEDAEFFFVANDATRQVLQYLKEENIPHYIWNNSPEQRKEWYINSVYRAWNFAGRSAKGQFVVFINSDMALTPNWLDNLYNAYNGSSCLASRLVESGKLPSGEYGIEKNFGRHYREFRESEFHKYAESIRAARTEKGGLYMPLLIKKTDFLSVGGYPEGNIVPYSDIFAPTIARRGESCVSGDKVLMDKLRVKGVVHRTVFNSIVYHFQMGEMDSESRRAEVSAIFRMMQGDFARWKRTTKTIARDHLPDSIYGALKAAIRRKRHEA